MTPDPRWLALLKASGWQTAAIAAALFLFLLAAHRGWIPPLEPWMIQLAVVGALLSGFLTLASTIIALLKFFPLQTWLLHWINVHRSKSGLRHYIPHMTEKEREIISYLLAKNQKTFIAAVDGGHAATLLSRRIVLILGQPGQQIDTENVPMTIPDPLWDVLVKHKAEFPYQRKAGKDQHPWRVSWMQR